MPDHGRRKAAGAAELRFGSRTVNITNPGKLMFPAAQFTKAHLIEYYVRASKWLLPHLKGRPVTLKRYPDGVDAEHFYEKDAPSFTPDWVRTFAVPRRTGTGEIRYIVIDDLATLAWCANLANIEIHPFLHRVPDIDTPNFIAFDLDPGDGADLLTCTRVALELRDVLKRLELECFPKVSGSKGLQIYVPLNTAVTYDTTRAFARTLAELMERQHPGLVISDMAKALRRNKVFIDWSQNSDFKTTVAPYSLRGKQTYPFVSVPVRWEELQEALEAGDSKRLYWQPEAALARFEQVGDLWAPVLKLKQKLPEEFAKEAAPRRGRSRKTESHSGGTELSALPDAAMKFRVPMLARLADELPAEPGWMYEIKLDGYRALALRSWRSTQLLSRNNKSLADSFPAIVQACGALDAGTILDGEIIAVDENGRPSFNLLQNHKSPRLPVFFYAFDLLAWKGKDTTGLPLEERRELLRQALAPARDPIRMSEALHAEPDALLRAAREQGLEGIVAKRISSAYEAGQRSGAWIKVKTNRTAEFVVGGYRAGKDGFDNLAVGYRDARGLVFIAKVKNGFTPAIKRQISEKLRPLEISQCPFVNLPEPKTARRGEALTAEAMKKYRWVKPEYIALVEFTDWTEADHLRHSRFVELKSSGRSMHILVP